MRRELVESVGQLVRHRQLGRVICVKLNDAGARVLGDHPPLQWRRDSPIPRTQHVIPVDAVEGLRAGWILRSATARLVAGTAVRSPTPQRPPRKTRTTRDAKPLPA